MNDKRTDEEERQEKELWKEWWCNIKLLTEERRSRALTRRCKVCGMGSLQKVYVDFNISGVEGICVDCGGN